MFYSCDGVDFGPVRAYGAIPPIGPVGLIGPSFSLWSSKVGIISETTMGMRE